MTEVSTPPPTENPVVDPSEYAVKPFMAEVAELDQLSLSDALTVVSVFDPRNHVRDVSIDDYEFFAGDVDYRKAVKKTYLEGGVEGVEGLVANHDHPILDAVSQPQPQDADRYMDLAVAGAKKILIDQEDADGNVEQVYVWDDMDGLDAEHTRIQLAYMRISKGLETGEIPDSEREYAELVLQKQEVELKKIQMLKAANTASNPSDGSERELARQVFVERNVELSGELNRGAYKGIIAQELRRINDFVPETDEDRRLVAEVKAQLESNLDALTGVEAALPEIPEETIETMTPIVLEQFKDFIDTWDEFGYADQLTSEEFVTRIEAIFDKIGLKELGAKVVYDQKATTVNVSGPAREMRVPASDKISHYNSDWLLSIVMHEYGHLVRSVVPQVEAPERTLLAKGTPNYLGPEEGFNAFNQIILLRSRGQSVDEVIGLWQDRYLVYGLAVGADGKERAAVDALQDSSRIQTLRNRMQGMEMSEASTKAKESMNTHVERFFRGSPFSDPGMVYAKDKVYYDGLIKNIEFFNELAKLPKEEIERLYKKLFIGKIDHTNPKELALVDKYVINK